MEGNTAPNNSLPAREMTKPTQLMTLLNAKKPNWREVDRRLRSENKYEAQIWFVKRNPNTGSIERKFLPIHSVLMSKAQVPVKILEKLYDAFPQSLECADPDGMLPLHWACWSRSPLDIIELLVKKNPSSTRCKDRYGRLPLHIACEYGVSSSEVAKLLINENPSSINAQNRTGHTPVDLIKWNDKNSQLLTYVVQMRRSAKNSVLITGSKIKTSGEDIVTNTKEQQSQALKETIQVEEKAQSLTSGLTDDIQGNALMGNEVMDVKSNRNGDGSATLSVQAGSKTNAKALRQSSFSSRVSFDPSMNMVLDGMENFLEQHRNKNRSAAKIPETEEDVSLKPSLLPTLSDDLGINDGTYSFEGECPEESPAVSVSIASEEKTFLANAIIEQRWDDALQRLRDKDHKGEAQEEHKCNSEGDFWLPLHEACARQPPPDFIEHLCLTYFEGMHKRDQHGRLPMHVACEYGASAEVVRVLFQMHRDAINTSDGNHRLPKDCLKEGSSNYRQCLQAFTDFEAMESRDRESLSRALSINHEVDDLKQPLLHGQLNEDRYTDDDGQTGTFTGKIVRTSNDDCVSQVSEIHINQGIPNIEDDDTRAAPLDICLCLSLITLLVLAIVFSVLFDRDSDETGDANDSNLLGSIPNDEQQQILGSDLGSNNVENYDLEQIMNSVQNPFRIQ